jgi:hypothetical protein
VVFMALFFVVMPMAMFFSPVIILFLSLFAEKNGPYLVAAGLLFLAVTLPVLVLLKRTIEFRKDVRFGKHLHHLAESKTFRELLAEEDPSAILAIPERYCDKECQMNLEKVSEKLKYQIIPHNDPEQILNQFKPGSGGGRAVYCYSKGSRHYDLILVSAADMIGREDSFMRPCKPGYICMANFQLRGDSPPEIFAHLFSIFGVKERFP